MNAISIGNKLIALSILMLAAWLQPATALAQPNIVRVEYFIDADPGFDKATAIPITNAANIANQVTAINIATVTEGIHNFFLRSKDADGKWSVTNRATFFRATLNNSLSNIVRAEYFIDNDPGFGAATSIGITPGAQIADQGAIIPLTGITEGIHNLYLRTQDATGNWSITNRATFFRGPVANTLANITRAEYFIDTDPGFGVATNIPISAGANIADKDVSIPLTGVAEGIHNLYLRTQDASGKWSITNRATFFRGPVANTLANITRAEYFIDTDPGFGAATNIPISAGANIADKDVSIPLTGVGEGIHNLYLRTQDATGNWSITNRATFFRGPVANTLANITRAEYFIDTDPGFGAATNIPISAGANIADKDVSIPLTGVGEGIHNLYLRTQDASGKWSITNRAVFFRAGGDVALPNIVKAEYFIDTDPGFGLGVNIPITPGTNIADAVVPVPLNGLSSGLHTLYLRSQDARGSWSITNLGNFASGSGVAIKLDGADDFVDLGPSFNQQNFTVDMWLKPGATQVTYADIIDNNHSGSFTNWVCQQDQNNVNTYGFGAMNTGVSFTLQPNVWQHLTLVKSPTAIQAYVNGLLIQSTPYNAGPINYSGNFLRLGRWGGGGRNWNGEMDEVRIWSRPLTAEEVAAAGCQKFTAGNPLFANLEAYYSFNEGSDNTAFDGSGNNRNGTLQNGVARVSSNIACLLTGPDKDGDGTPDADDCAPDDPAKWQSENLYVDSDNDGYDAGRQVVCYGATIPAGYKQTTLGADCNDTDATINVRRPFGITGANNICAGSQGYTITNSQAGITYTWTLPAGGTFSPASGTATTVQWSSGGTHVLTAKASKACPLDSFATISVMVTAGVPVLAPGIALSNRTLTASALAAGATAWQWFKDGAPLNGSTGQSITVPNTESGSYTVAYTNLCGLGPVSNAVPVAVAKTDQNITFTPVPAKTFGDAAFDVTATASSALPITSYAIESGPASIIGNTVTITGAGTIVVKATQAGNATFNPADATLSIPVAKAAATISFNNTTALYDGAAKQATAGTTPLGLNVQLSYNGSASAPTAAGIYTLSGAIVSPNYQGSATGIFTIEKASQSISITNPGNKSFNDPAFGIVAQSTAGLPVSFGLQTIPASGVASLNGNLVTLLGAGGTVTITATQAGNSNYNAALPASVTFTVRPPEANDMQVVSLLAPTNGCGLGVTAPVTIRLRNTGTQPASGFPVSYRINGDPAVVETFAGTIAPNSNTDYTFNTKGVFAQTGVNYQLTLTVSLAGDEIPGNNTLLAAVARFAPATMSLSADTAICAGGTATLRSFGAGTTVWTNGPTASTFVVNPTATTTYTANVTDVNGCTTETLSTKVTVNANPTVSAGPNQTILRGSSATLVATGAASYLWSNGVSNAENTVAPTATTSYSVTGTGANGCTAVSSTTVTVNFSALNVSPGLLQFGGVVVDSTRTADITITNTGTLPETITAITGLAAPFSSTVALPLQLPAGSTLQIPVAFKPTAPLFYENKVALATTAGNFNIVIRGTGAVPAPAWVVEPASFNFGKVERNTTATQNLVIKNTGNVSVRVNSVSSSSARFVGSTSPNLTIPVGGSALLTVRFTPNAIASFTGSITVRSTTGGPDLLRAFVSGSGFVPGAPPTIQFVSKPPYDGTGGVNPEVGKPGTYTYSIIYRHPQGVAPMAGFPKVGIDRNTDRDFADDGEGPFTMAKEGNSTNWAAGVVYNFSTTLPVSELYGYQFFATDANNNEALVTEYKKGPIVSREILDLHIFASDITFSKANPAVNEDFTVTAVINNNSPYAASDVPVRFYYKDSLFLFNDTIPFIEGRTKASITRTLNFSPDGFYPIKVWIDSARTLGEGNILNNYASRPVIVGNFSVPGTINVAVTANPSGCKRGKVTYSGRATYRGLNLAGTPPVEGAEVTLILPANLGGAQTVKLTTDINGNFYYHHDPCADNPDDTDCEGYLCGVTYNYSVAVTDFTLTSPTVGGSVVRPCEPCDRPAVLQTGIGTQQCIVEGKPFTTSASFVNFERDNLNRVICAPSVYRDTMLFFIDGVLVAERYADSITSCESLGFTLNQNALAKGQHTYGMTHTYYFADSSRNEQSFSTSFEVLPNLADLKFTGFGKTGHTSFAFAERNMVCGTTAGRHMVYLYDSLPGYTEKVLLDSFVVNSLAPEATISFSYSNPLLASGCHYISFRTDVYNTVAETNEGNNLDSAIFCVDKPDLHFAPRNGKNGNINISSTSANAGTAINFSIRVANSGNAVNQPFAVQWRANGALLGGKILIPSLGIGEEVTVVSPPFTVPVSLCPVRITVKVDSDDNVDEASESNNFDTTQFGINITAGRSCTADDEETIGAGFFSEDDVFNTVGCQPYIASKGVLAYYATTVRNTGIRDARNVKVQFKLNGETLGTDVIPLIRAGQKVESGFFYAFDTVGRFIVNAFADYTREICETNELDNIGNIHLDVKRSSPDLEVLSQYIAPSNLNPQPNQSVTIVSSVVNRGDAPAPPSKVRFWVDDVQLGNDIPIDSLYPGMDTTVMATVTYASGIVGPKIVKVRADVLNEVTNERRRSNNEATRAIIVGAAPDFARAISEAITLSPASFNVGDSIFIRHHIRNYGGDAGAAWVRFYYRSATGEKILIDSVRLGLESNDSVRLGLRWKVAEPFGQIITEIGNSIPPEFNEFNNIDSLRFDAALPLTLLSFTGQVQGQTALLQWSTTSEVNVKHFELERSTNGSTFTRIAQIAATNGTGTHQYSYPDADFGTLPATRVLYRLKMMDKDGQYTYSPIVLLSKQNTPLFSMKLYPNPAHQTANVEVISTTAGKAALQLMDVGGKQISLRTVEMVRGRQTYQLPLNGLAQGAYILVVQMQDGSRQVTRFVKD